MTRADLETQTRSLYADAFVKDEPHTLEVTRAVTGGEVFVWSNLTIEQLRALHRGLFTTARLV